MPHQHDSVKTEAAENTVVNGGDELVESKSILLVAEFSGRRPAGVTCSQLV